MKKEVIVAIQKAAQKCGLADISIESINLDYPENPEHGDFSTNIAMANAKKLGLNPKALAENIVAEFNNQKSPLIESVSIAGPGFINFKIKDESFIKEAINSLSKNKSGTAISNIDSGKKIMVEYTDPNPFKIFHIGHLMSNAVGESISRLMEVSGAEVIRACYQGDVGLHVAKTIWAIMKDENGAKFADLANKSVVERVKYLGEMYVAGAKFDDDAAVQKEIAAINKKIFDKSDATVNDLYEKGRKWSLEYFDEIYKRLGTNFNKFFFESEVADLGMKIVKEQKVFKESEGAIVFPGEDYGLHTRVFVTSQGLPTYETKEIGLNTEKFRLYPDLTQSVIVTAHEQDDYFKVLLKVLSLTNPEIAAKTKHMSHGILRFASGKMSSRKGNIISADSLLGEIKEMVMKKIADRGFSPAESDELADMIAIAAIKYTILRQAIGGDVIFDSAASISFEGDSGPYLQYSAVRGNSILEKAEKEGIGVFDITNAKNVPTKATPLEKMISRFPDVAERARAEYAPQLVSNYLINLASTFNGFYANQTIVDAKDPLSPYYVALTKVFVETMTKGLWILGIKVPKRM